MVFQTGVAFEMGYGIPGEFYDNSPHRALPYIIQSTDPTTNIFGNVGTISTTADNVVQMGGLGAFAGFLVDPKNHVTAGTAAGGSFAPNLTLPNGETAAFLTMGRIYVQLPASANVGDRVYYNNTTGALTTLAPGTQALTGTTYAQAIVIKFDVNYPDVGAVPGLAVIEVTPQNQLP